MNQGKIKLKSQENSIMRINADYSDLIPHIGDINIQIDESSLIVRINTPADSPLGNLQSWKGMNINNCLTIESKEKLDTQLTSLSDIKRKTTTPFELNHISKETGEFPVRYKGFKLAEIGQVLLIGNDLSPVAEIQKKFVNSQLSLEREYTRYRSFETKYKALISLTSDPIVMVDGFSGLIIDISDSGTQLFGLKKEKMIGQRFEKFVCWDEQKKLHETLKADSLVKNSRLLSIKIKKESPEIKIQTTMFRAENELCLMIMLSSSKDKIREWESEEFPLILSTFYENTKDSIIFTDKTGTIKYVNGSFLSLCNTGSEELVLGRSFSDFLSRGIVDLKVLIDAALENGATLPFTTQLISAYDTKIDIEISGTRATNEYGTYICFLITYNPAVLAQKNAETVVSEHATQNIMKLVGSAPLKELVADTSDIVEKICIETALKMTKNNRVAAAEMLNLSRQSLYVKLRKYNLL